MEEPVIVEDHAGGRSGMEWVRTLASPMQRARAWCLMLALGLVVLAAKDLWSSRIAGAIAGTASISASALGDAMMALAGAASAWFLFAAANALRSAWHSGDPADARRGMERLARYFVASALGAVLSIVLGALAAVGLFTVVLHGLASASP